MYVCSECIVDEHLRAVVVQNADEDAPCSFCEEERTPAAPLEALVEHIQNCFHFRYEDAAGSLPWDGEEGRYFGPTYDTQEALENIGLYDAITGGNCELFDAICSELGDETWTDRDPFALPEDRRLNLSWESFSGYIKHHRRFFFLGGDPKYAEFDGGDTLLGPEPLLRNLVQFAIRYSLVRLLPAGTALFRVRHQRRGEKLRSPLELGAPPPEKAEQTNRMSPPGIAMTYLAEDEATALAETGEPRPKGKRKTYAVAKFWLSREVAVLDLSGMPSVPGFFDLDAAPHRDARAFLSRFASEVSKPIARDNHVHIDYVPTQVVTEYFRDAKALRSRAVRGLRFQSSRNPPGLSLVLFGGREILDLEPDERAQLTDTEREQDGAANPLLKLDRCWTRKY